MSNHLYCETRAGWLQEWVRPTKLRNKAVKIREVVPGPFSSPKLLKTLPIVTTLPHSMKNACISINKEATRRGIPDPWAECLALKGFCNKNSCRILKKNFVPCCIRIKLTKAIWNDLGLPLVQGIPDPSKNSASTSNNNVKCRTLCITKNVRNAQEYNQVRFHSTENLNQNVHLKDEVVSEKRCELSYAHGQINKQEITATLTPRNFISIKADKPRLESKRSKSKVKKHSSKNKHDRRVDCEKSVKGQKLCTVNDEIKRIQNKANGEIPTTCVSKQPCHCIQNMNKKETIPTIAQLETRGNPRVLTSTKKPDELKLLCCRCNCPYFKMSSKEEVGPLEISDWSYTCPHCVRTTVKNRYITVKNSWDKEDEREMCCRGSEDRKNEVKPKRLSSYNNEIRIPARQSRQALYSNGLLDTADVRIRALNSRHECKSITDVTRSAGSKTEKFLRIDTPEHGSTNDSLKINYSSCSCSHSSVLEYSKEKNEEDSYLFDPRSGCGRHGETVSSDSGDYADISDVSRNSGTCAREATAVTSLTLIELLNNNVTLTSAGRRSRKTRRDKYRKCECLNERFVDDELSKGKKYTSKFDLS